VITLGCRGAAGEVCGGMAELVTVEKLRGRRVVGLAAAKPRGGRTRTVLVAVQGYTVSVGRTVTLRLYAGGPSSQLLKRFRRLPVRLVVAQATALGTRTAASRTFKLPARPAKPRR
jgi:hypothetical protein